MQKAYFASGETLDIEFRKNQLKKLYNAINENKQQIIGALYTDLHKSPFETYETEIGIVLEEIRFLIKHLRAWAKPKRVRMPISLFPSYGTTYFEPPRRSQRGWSRCRP